MGHSSQFWLRLSFILLVGALLGSLAWNLALLRTPLLLPPNPVMVADNPLRFVIVAPLYDHPFWTDVAAGATANARELHVAVEFTGPRQASVDEQVKLLDMATAAQVDGIITQGVPDARVAAAIARAADRGIPVVTVETDLPGGENRRLTFIGSDNYQGGRLAAQELILRTGGQAVVGIVRGHFGPEANDPRTQGFRDAIAAASGIHIVDVEASDLNRTIAGQKAVDMLRLHPDLTAIYTTTALDTAGVVQSATALSVRQRLLLIGWDNADQTDGPLFRSALQVEVVEDPQAMGRQAVTALEAYLRRDVRPPAVMNTPIMIRSGGDRR